LTPGADELCVFAVKRGEVEERCDVNYNHPKYRALVDSLITLFGNRFKTIGEIADVICGPFGTAITQNDYTEVGLPLLRITNITKHGFLDCTDMKYINKDCADRLARMQVSAGDIVISQRGTLGQCAVVDNTYPLFNISANLIAVKNIKGTNAEYVRNYLLSPIGVALLQRTQSGQVQGKITTQDIEDMPIPVISNPSKLNKVIDNAYDAYTMKRREADTLLAGMDGFVREIIGLPEEDKTRSMLFAVKISHKDAGRIDPEFHNPFYQHRIKRIKEMNHDTLGNIIEFSSETWNQKSDFEGTFPYIEISGVGLKTNEYEITQTPVAEAPSRAKMIVRNGDIIVSTTRPHRGAIATINCNDGYYIASTGFCVLRKMKRNDISPEYLQWVLLNDYVLQQFLQRSSGGNYPAIIQDEMKKVVIPIPDKDIQNKIVKEAIHRKSNAHQLKREAEAEWAAAKTTFEQELLGGMDK